MKSCLKGGRRGEKRKEWRGEGGDEEGAWLQELRVMHGGSPV